MIGRRAFLVMLSALCAARNAGAQPASRLRKVGVIRPRSANQTADDPFFRAFKEGMQALGHVEGKNVVYDYRQGEIGTFPELAQELVRQRVEVILAATPQAAFAARQATSSIPIVFAVVGDPVKSGLAESLSRPGGNLTGLTAFGSDLGGKRLEIIKDVVPRAKRIAVLWNSSVPDKVIEWNNTLAPARSAGLELQSLEVRTNGDFDGAFDAARRSRAEALVVFAEPLTFGNINRIVAFAAAQRIPAIFAWREAVEAGALVSFGPSISDNYRRAAGYVDRILKGAKPADLPIEQPTKFELVVNLKTAKALGITVPQAVLVRADEVIQ